MAVEGHGGLQPQGIPGPQAAGEGPGGRQRVPKGGGVRRGAVELKAVLAGVPGAGDQAGPAVHRAVEHGGVVLRRKVRRQGAQQRLRTGPLERSSKVQSPARWAVIQSRSLPMLEALTTASQAVSEQR